MVLSGESLWPAGRFVVTRFSEAFSPEKCQNNARSALGNNPLHAITLHQKNKEDNLNRAARAGDSRWRNQDTAKFGYEGRQILETLAPARLQNAPLLDDKPAPWDNSVSVGTASRHHLLLQALGLPTSFRLAAAVPP